MVIEEIKFELKNGKPVCRNAWPLGYYIYVRNNQLRACVLNDDGTSYCVYHCSLTDNALSIEDLLADDWVFYDVPDGSLG